MNYTTRELCKRYGIAIVGRNPARDLARYLNMRGIEYTFSGNTKARRWILLGEDK